MKDIEIARILKLADWLRRSADREEGTARVLEKIPSGDPQEARTRARLMREVADRLESTIPVLEPRR